MRLLKYNEIASLNEEKKDEEFEQEKFFNACKIGSLPAVKKYIEEGGDIEAGSINGITGFFYACMNDHLDLVKYLVSKGANINVRVGYQSDQTPFEIACVKNNIDIVKYLIELGVDINDRCGRNKWTALMQSAFFNHFDADIIELLIENGADVNIKDINNKTALDIALENNNEAAIKALKEAKEILLKKNLNINNANKTVKNSGIF